MEPLFFPQCFGLCFKTHTYMLLEVWNFMVDISSAVHIAMLNVYIWLGAGYVTQLM